MARDDKTETKSVDTLISTALSQIEDPSGAIVPSIQPSTTFERGPDHELIGDFTYRRNASPTIAATESVLSTLDGGVGAQIFSSGMAAVTAFFESLPRGSRVVAPRVMYHGAQDWLVRLDRRGDIDLTLFEELSSEGLASAIDETVDVAWVETPTNPTWDIIDIEAAARATHDAGGVLVVDSTVAPPVTTRPLDLGADLVFHSATKYLNGHSDITAGVLVTGAETEIWTEVCEVRVSHGSVLSPFDAWLLMRGLRTLGVRYRRASASALAIATHFEGHPGVDRVLYPGLPSHPQHGAAARQMLDGFGGMLSILVRGGAEAARQVATGTTLFTTATSLGGTESLIEHRAAVEGPNSIVAENLLRVSVGLEDPDDLIDDLEQALKGKS